MRVLIMMCLAVLALVSPLLAVERSSKESRSQGFEERYDDLREQMYDIKYDLAARIRYQEETIKEQGEVIDELQLKIKDLESELFQATQSLRNLELEVWDMKKDKN